MAAQKSVSVAGQDVEVLPFFGELKYLWRLVQFSSCHAAELKHRINRGWVKFATLKKTLCDKGCPLQLRLKLFQAMVGATVL